ncbi:pentapeptide repeat-containing protein, partial [Shinella sp. SUS2]|uniref:pentapeptide repeat-containing protein n=1 Tax=Shinella sp. SUS2 TaxID=1692241 RepID=UPI0018D1369E
MRDSAFLSVESSPYIERAFEAVASSESDNFLHLARLAGLDPATAFRYGNLKNVDFSDCDLRGLDFTGACLVGATGNEATIFDKTTILQGADIESSLFSPSRLNAWRGPFWRRDARLLLAARHR